MFGLRIKDRTSGTSLGGIHLGLITFLFTGDRPIYAPYGTIAAKRAHAPGAAAQTPSAPPGAGHGGGHPRVQAHAHALAPLSPPGVCCASKSLQRQGPGSSVSPLPSPPAHPAPIPGPAAPFRRQVAPAALGRPGRGLQPELLASPPPPLEWDNLGVICGRPAKALNLLLGTWISFPRRGTGGERGEGKGGSRSRARREDPGRVRPPSALAAWRSPSCKAPPQRGV